MLSDTLPSCFPALFSQRLPSNPARACQAVREQAPKVRVFSAVTRAQLLNDAGIGFRMMRNESQEVVSTNESELARTRQVSAVASYGVLASTAIKPSTSPALAILKINVLPARELIE